MLLDISAQVQKFVRNGTKLYAYTFTFIRLLELLHKMGVFQQRITVSNSLGTEQHCVIEVRVFRVIRSPCVQQRLPSMEQERNIEFFLFTCLLEREKFGFVEADGITPVLSTDEIET